MKTLCILIAVLFLQASMSEANNKTFEACQAGVVEMNRDAVDHMAPTDAVTLKLINVLLVI